LVATFYNSTQNKKLNQPCKLEQQKMFKVFCAHPDAIVPKRAEDGSAGYDLTSVENEYIGPGERKMIDTGIILECPSDCYARIAPRSGNAVKYGLDVLAGVVDSSYRNNIRVVLYNTDRTKGVEIQVGERIAQLIFEKIYTPVIEQVDSADKLSSTDRGVAGFGSTGI
jgi:dUTP pyrophosphatase